MMKKLTEGSSRREEMIKQQQKNIVGMQLRSSGSGGQAATSLCRKDDSAHSLWCPRRDHQNPT